MNKLFRFGGAAALVAALLPFSVLAATVRQGNAYELRAGETVNDNLYAAGGSGVIEGAVRGDLILAGGNILVAGSVSKDVAAGGGTIVLGGTVGEDVRAAGGNVTVRGSNGGDLVAAGGTVDVTSGARVGGDALVTGGRITISGTISGNVKIAGGDVIIDGPIGGSVTVRARKLTLGDHAAIGGDLTYRAPQELTRAPGATVRGKVSFEEVGVRPAVWQLKGLLALLSAAWLLKLLIILVTALAFVAIWGERVREVMNRAALRFGGSFLTGFVVLVVVPAAAILAFMTIVGVLVGALAALIYALAVVVASIGSGVLLGTLSSKYGLRSVTGGVLWKEAVVGVVLLQLVKLIPFVGAAVSFVLFLAALGSISRYWYERVWLAR